MIYINKLELISYPDLCSFLPELKISVAFDQSCSVRQVCMRKKS